jgi:hypothetical protein
MKRVLVAVACLAIAAIVAAGAAPGTARADAVRQANLYTSGDICVDGISAAQDGPSGWGQGYGLIEISTAFPGLGWIPGMSCAWALSRPPGYVAVGLWWYFWNGSQWIVAGYLPYQYNSSNVSYLEQFMGLPSPSPFGFGWYGNIAGLWAWNGQWYGGSLWSGYQWYKR